MIFGNFVLKTTGHLTFGNYQLPRLIIKIAVVEYEKYVSPKKPWTLALFLLLRKVPGPIPRTYSASLLRTTCGPDTMASTSIMYVSVCFRLWRLYLRFEHIRA